MEKKIIHYISATVNSLHNRQYRDIELASSLGRVRNSRSFFQSNAGVSISTDGRQNASATFFQKKEATGLNNVVNKKYVIKSE